MSRLIEKIISDQLLFYLKSNNLISKSQFGFLPRKSTELQLFKYHKFFASELINGKYIDLIYFDYAKAFDTVSHSKLLIK